VCEKALGHFLFITVLINHELNIRAVSQQKYDNIEFNLDIKIIFNDKYIHCVFYL
jgi:hypothetical protein